MEGVGRAGLGEGDRGRKAQSVIRNRGGGGFGWGLGWRGLRLFAGICRYRDAPAEGEIGEDGMNRAHGM